MNKFFTFMLASLVLISVFFLIEPAAVSPSSFTVMSYNVENLFDTSHEKGKKDFTQLPLKKKKSSKKIQDFCSEMKNAYYKKSCFELDWNKETYLAKIKNISKVIMAFDEGRGADIISFQEVENKNVLKDLVKYGLSDKGYSYISLIEGPDSRGIDTGVISRYPLIEETLHRVNILEESKGRTTRGILESTFRVNKKNVTIFSNHWPSQGNSDQTRLVASKILASKAVNSNSDIVIAVGDFNQTHSDSPHGINLNILPLFEDVEVLGRKLSKETALGTHWYRGE